MLMTNEVPDTILSTLYTTAHLITTQCCHTTIIPATEQETKAQSRNPGPWLSPLGWGHGERGSVCTADVEQESSGFLPLGWGVGGEGEGVGLHCRHCFEQSTHMSGGLSSSPVKQEP